MPTRGKPGNHPPGYCKTGKVHYRDRIAALLALASTARRDGSRREKTEKRAYRCPYCHGWHLSSRT